MIQSDGNNVKQCASFLKAILETKGSLCERHMSDIISQISIKNYKAVQVKPYTSILCIVEYVQEYHAKYFRWCKLSFVPISFHDQDMQSNPLFTYLIHIL